MNEPLPYTTSIKNAILKDVEKLKVYELASPEFKDGYGQAIKEVVRLLGNKTL